MALVNEHFLKLPGSYLFSDIAKKVNAFKVTHPGKNLIRLGIGDVTRPLPPVCIEAMHRAVDEMANAKTFRGYGPEPGDFKVWIAANAEDESNDPLLSVVLPIHSPQF